ncbi:DinB family protein [Peribacillus muralis]|uniref:DinB family protein n=1 Tax=Peribacillus muralis TaxID=264697 RepID=UPI00070E67FB|nr:DinB family protein [Peribacillus muralis]
MSTNNILKKLEEITDHYIVELNRYSPEQLKLKPSSEEWSIGQLYHHLIDSIHSTLLPAIENCMNRDQETTEGKTADGEEIFNIGEFPPTRIKVPGRPQPINSNNREDIKKLMTQAIEKVKNLEPHLPSILSTYKSPHPRYGYLTATEWVQLSDMHFRHHLRQKKRLDEWLFDK